MTKHAEVFLEFLIGKRLVWSQTSEHRDLDNVVAGCRVLQSPLDFQAHSWNSPNKSWEGHHEKEPCGGNPQKCGFVLSEQKLAHYHGCENTTGFHQFSTWNLMKTPTCLGPRQEAF